MSKFLSAAKFLPTMLNRRWHIEIKDILEFGLQHGDSCVTYEHFRDFLQAYQHQLRIPLSSLTYQIYTHGSESLCNPNCFISACTRLHPGCGKQALQESDRCFS